MPGILQSFISMLLTESLMVHQINQTDMAMKAQHMYTYVPCSQESKSSSENELKVLERPLLMLHRHDMRIFFHK